MDENLQLYTSNVVISEDENDPDVLNAKFVICDFDKNKNNVQLNKENINSWVSTLVNKPLLGKIKKNLITSDFTGHNMKVTKKKDENGKEYVDVDFDTSAFGTFTNAQVEEIEGKDYITANAKIWKRFKEACSIIKKRAEDGELHTSWEISVNKYHMDGNTKVIDDGTFIGHTLLGSNVPPAYDCSGLLAVASAEETPCPDDELSEAIINDLNAENASNINETGKGDNGVDTQVAETVVENGQVENAEQVINEPEQTVTEPEQTVNVSSLAMEDICGKITKELCNRYQRWMSISYVYPEEHRVIVHDYDKEGATSQDFLEFTYSIEGDQLTLSEPTERKLVFSEANIVEDKETTISELNGNIEKLNGEIAEKNDVITSANAKVNELTDEIKNLNTTISELTVYKEQVEKIEAEKREAELSQKRDELKAYALSSKQFTEEELETSEEIKNLISNLDLQGIKSIIADRFMKSISETKVEETNVASEQPKETSQQINVVLSSEDSTVKKGNAIRQYILNK